MTTSLSFTLIFTSLLVINLLIKFWLANRQMRHVAQHRAMADLLPAKPEVCVVANAGHMLTMEEPAAVAQLFRNWLN
jgi:STE24 endopeptidase